MTGIEIKGIGIVRNATSYVEAGAAATRAALADAGVPDDQLGMLINAGASRDMNISEPAIAALIQQGADIHPSFALDDEVSTTTFDLLDGTHGFSTAASLIGDMIGLGDIAFGAVIVGDVHPSMNPFLTANFPIRNDVYAVVFGASENSTLTVSAPQRTGHPPRAEVFVDLNGAGPTGRSSIGIDLMEYDDEYYAAVAAGITSLDSSAGSDSVDMDSVLIAPWPASENDRFRQVLGDRGDIAVVNFGPTGEDAAYFTASPAAALEYSRTAGLDAAHDRVLTPTAPSSAVTVIAAAGTAAGK